MAHVADHLSFETLADLEHVVTQGNRIWRGEKDTLLSAGLFGAGFRLRNSADTSRRE
jgi:hypothetical protein